MELSCGNDTKFKNHIWPCPLILWPPSQKIEVKVNTTEKHHYCMPKGNAAVVQKLQIWPLTFWPKINRGPSRVKVNIYVKNHHCMSIEGGVMVQKPLFTDWQTDGQTDKQPWWNQYTSTTLAGYTNLFSMWKNRWQKTPLEVKIL